VNPYKLSLSVHRRKTSE